MSTRVEEFARALPAETTASVRSASILKTDSRITALGVSFGDVEGARSHAAAIKEFVLANLGRLLIELEANCKKNGIHVHWARDASEANELILGLCKRALGDSKVIVKAKSMVTEEIHLNSFLEAQGYAPVETDLGEFVVQIDGDTPSHIVTPIIHKNRRQIAESFAREKIGPYTEVPEELALQAREHLRSQFAAASIGISGVNFACASTGRLVLVENEGNNRLSTTVPDVHIAVMGIEKVVPDEACLSLFLPLLAGSATGQKLTSYVHLIKGPRGGDESDGPREVHLVLLDNNRTKVLNGHYRDVLKCIRCGACLNVCPVYRQGSGHAYGHVYSGPIGAVLAPAMEGVEKLGDLAKASTLCGSCEEVCPVKIPLPHMLLQLRDEAFRAGVNRDGIPWSGFVGVATRSGIWRAGLTLLPMASSLPHPLKTKWREFRQLPQREGRNFRRHR